MLLAILFFSSITSGDWRACVSLSRDVSAFHEYFLNFKLFVAAGVGSVLQAGTPGQACDPLDHQASSPLDGGWGGLVGRLRHEA